MNLKNDIHLSLETSVSIVLKVHKNSYWPQQKTIIVSYWWTFAKQSETNLMLSISAMLCCRWSTNYQRDRFNPVTFLCPSQIMTRISIVRRRVFFMFSGFIWGVIVRFADIDGIVDHHCLNFLFINFIAIISLCYLFFFQKMHGRPI